MTNKPHFVIIEDKNVESSAVKEEKTSNATRHCISKDLQHLPFPPDIKLRANNICTKVTKRAHRKRRRLYLIFVCIYWAYKEIGEEKDPNTIANLIGLPTNKIQAAFSLFSPSQINYRPQKKYTNVTELLPDYCDKLGLDKDNVLSLTKEVMGKERYFDDEFPQTLAAGLLNYYARINGINLSVNAIATTCGRTTTSVTNITTRVAQAHNT